MNVDLYTAGCNLSSCQCGVFHSFHSWTCTRTSEVRKLSTFTRCVAVVKKTDHTTHVVPWSYRFGYFESSNTHSLPSCCCTYLEQSAPTFHVRTLSVYFPKTPHGDFPLHAFLPITRCRNVCSACAVIVVIFGHLSRSFAYLFT